MLASVARWHWKEWGRQKKSKKGNHPRFFTYESILFKL
jgi:hypothetical protein